MLDPVKPFDAHVGARILDFLDSRCPWNRKLWNIGLALTLRETLEAIDAYRAGVLSEASVGSLLNTAQRIAGTDPGAGAPEERQLLQAALRSKPRSGGLDYHLLAQRESSIRASYLARWAAALRVPNAPRAERTARSVASHLLDLGYSSDFLHRWWKFRLQHQPGLRPIADLVEEAQDLALAPPREFEVMVPVGSRLEWRTGPPPIWRSPPTVAEWLRTNDFSTTGVRQDGGLLIPVQALDPGAAAARVSEILDQLSARMAVGTKRGLVLLDHVWVKGDGGPHQIDRTRRGVWVEALDRENQLYDAQSTGGINAAVELLAHLQSSSPGAAVAGGWAAIEALLSEPQDRAGAAERLAMLVACSFPRAELTRLSYVLSRRDEALGRRLVEVAENRERCRLVAASLIENPPFLGSLPPSDRAAVARMQELLAEPHNVLEVVAEHASVAIRRLYRQRNLVLHWGKTDAVALRASLRTAAPLVGAGIDRIIHAHYVDGLSPLQLVARAKSALATVGMAGGPHCTDLLS